MFIIEFLADNLYAGLLGVWWIVQLWPWPMWTDFFKGVALFVGLYPIRIIMGAIIPERQVSRSVRRKYARKNQAVPSKADHQGAAAISSLIHY